MVAVHKPIPYHPGSHYDNSGSLRSPAFAVILSGAKDPDELRPAQTARPLPPTLCTPLSVLCRSRKMLMPRDAVGLS
jgi:hypothetical protein